VLDQAGQHFAGVVYVVEYVVVEVYGADVAEDQERGGSRRTTFRPTWPEFLAV
jgi:hypothetical protein